jgi:hypothetical protein
MSNSVLGLLAAVTVLSTDQYVDRGNTAMTTLSLSSDRRTTGLVYIKF